MTCTKCGLSRFRRQIVDGYTQIPADILFVGDAPNKTEDMLGVQFVGENGGLLDAAIRQATLFAGLQTPPTHHLTNIICCRPTDSVGGPNRQPKAEEILACRSRLLGCVGRVKPKAIILLGKVAKSNAKRLFDNVTCLVHPTYILKVGGTESPQFLAFCRALSSVFQVVKENQ